MLIRTRRKWVCLVPQEKMGKTIYNSQLYDSSLGAGRTVRRKIILQPMRPLRTATCELTQCYFQHLLCILYIVEFKSLDEV
jgi:hypothetical protein